MTQEFFKTTLISKYIKYLLANSPIPQYSFINENEDMVEGGLYTYKHHILRCTHSGRFTGLNGAVKEKSFLQANEATFSIDPFNIDGSSVDNQHMSREEYSNNMPDNADTSSGWMTLIKPDEDNIGYFSTIDVMPLSVTDDLLSIQNYVPAQFQVLSNFLPNEYKPGVTQVFHSNTSYYDTETHKYLGEYLRYLKNMYDLDLMSMYNCYSYDVTRNISLGSRVKENTNDVVLDIIEEYNKKQKVLLVPIKFNRTYTIAFDSDTPVQMSAVFYNKKLLMDGKKQYYLYKDLNEEVIIHNNLRFSKPVTYSIKAPSSNTHRYERSLYLAIQVSTSNNSPLTVLEGDYSQNGARVVADVIGLREGEGTVNRLSSMMVSKLSLLEKSDTQRPFSDKLLQYLVRNTIDTREDIDDNIQNVIKQIKNFDYGYDGQWTTYLRYVLYNRYMSMAERDDISYTDILGYVDNDVEQAVRRGYLTNA